MKHRNEDAADGREVEDLFGEPKPVVVGYEIPAAAIIEEANRQEAERATAEVHAVKQAPVRTVGRFTYDPATGMIEGPADYIQSEAYRRRMAAIIAGTDAVLNFSFGETKDVPTAILVSLQTDYAGWAGIRGLLEGLR